MTSRTPGRCVTITNRERMTTIFAFTACPDSTTRESPLCIDLRAMACRCAPTPRKPTNSVAFESRAGFLNHWAKSCVEFSMFSDICFVENWITAPSDTYAR